MNGSTKVAPDWLVSWAATRSVSSRKGDSQCLVQIPPGPTPEHLKPGDGTSPSITDQIEEASRTKWSPQEEAQLRSALAYIPAVERDIWLRVGMAIHSERWEPCGYTLWCEWSKTATEKYNEADQVRTWRSFNRNYGGRRVYMNSVYHMALERGWTSCNLRGSSESNGEARTNSSRGQAAAEVSAPQKSSDENLIGELASLSIIAYGRRRKESAKQLGIRVTALDKAVERRRAELGRGTQELMCPHWINEPWPDPVDGDALILALVRRIRSHVVMCLEACSTVALWIIFTWLHAEAAIHSPILMVTSPEAECGKTTLLNLIGLLARRALSSVGISPAALYRSIEKWKPTLIIDEADVAFIENADLRAVVNSGWTRGQGVVRCDGEENEPRLFSTFCPKAIGLKGKKLPDTTASRAIVIELKRKLADDKVTDFRHVDDPGLQELRRQLLRWANDNGGALRNANPTLPPGFTNRVAANWAPLLATAHAAGGEFPDKARAAAATIAKVKAALDASVGIQLLADIRTVFGSADRLFSWALIEKLAADPEGPWAGYNRGKPFTQKQLANRLKAYGIVSETIWIDGKSFKGYKRVAFEDAWKRYLPG
jgi:Protein of unknown function (DUF3631)/Primase C terminal 2 (PriCT-2)